MKKILALVAALSIGSAYAQTSGTGGMGGMMNVEGQGQKAEQGQRHMIEFNTQALPSLVYSLTKDKAKGTSSNNDGDITLGFNYAYTIHPNIQVGGRFNYMTGINGNNDTEQMDLQAGGWFNTKAGDLQNSPYISALIGAGYAHTFGANGGRDDLIMGTVALGKRFSLERFGVQHVTWTPEVAFTNVNSTADESFDYRQATEFRLVQFSVIW